MEPYTFDLKETQHENSQKLFGQFDTYRTAYKHINSQPIHAIFIVPKHLPPGPRPLLVRFHGGGFCEGEAEGSMRPFFLELALKHGAVILAPDYRLRPEHELAEGVDDIRSFWTWVEGSVQQVVQECIPDLELEVNNLLVCGESAGGYHAVQTVLLSMTTLLIKVLFLQYPAVDLAGIFRLGRSNLGQESVKPPVLLPDIYPYSIVQDHLAAREPGKICTRAKFGSRMELMGALLLADKMCDISGPNAWLDPMTSLETAGRLPPVLLYHSKEDDMIPWQHTEAFAEKLKRLHPDAPLYLTYNTGDHAFDGNHTMATPWLKEPLEFVQKYWPSG
ncbi:hypothetical protein FQN55_003263 [Onygenales sp. PD_40]|nr:hypothetical protein FQN55_003263 [Onygenales sp. PD_40]KAK2789582.1 hypothetical protein FQN53_001701 [Emmonsiellopsis sp. PD_33]